MKIFTRFIFILVSLYIVSMYSIAFSANSKVTALPENTTPVGTDLLMIVDDPSGTPASEKITVTNLLSLPRDYVQMTPVVAPAYSEALFYYDSTLKTFVFYNEEPDISLQVGQEGWIRVYNDTGGDITDGKICYLSGEVAGGLSVGLAIADDPAKCLGTIGWATHTIEDGTWGYITRWGLLNNQNTLGETTVTKLWLSATSAGDYVTTAPTSPYYLIGVGTMGVISATVGTIDVSVSIGTNTAGVIKIFNGSVLEDTSTSVASNGTDTVTLSYEKSGGGDLSLFFDAAFTVLDTTPAATVSLTIGSDISPTLNYVYIPKATMVLTASTVGFPDTQHVPVATVIVQSAASVLADGLYKLHAWTDHLSNGDDQGHLSHVNRWVREQHATWLNGAVPTTTITVNGGAIDNVDFAITSGEVLQLHDHAMPAIDTATTGHIYAVNDDTTAYRKVTDLSVLDEDSTGASLRSNNTYYSIVVWGVVSEDSGDSQLYCNLPSGFYITELGALNDSSKYSNYTIPSEYKGTGFLIARLTFRYQTVASGTITESETEDLRGLFPSTSAGGGSPSAGNEFSDNLFKIQNVADITKQIAFDASGITTGTTRTISMPDQNIDLTPGVDLQAYDADTSKTDVNETVSGDRDYTGGIDTRNASSINSGPNKYTADGTLPSEEGSYHYNSGVVGHVGNVLMRFNNGEVYHPVEISDTNWGVAAPDDASLNIYSAAADGYIPAPMSGDGTMDFAGVLTLSSEIRTKDTGWTITDTGTAVAVANGVQGFVVPASWGGMNITSVIAVVDTAGTTGTTDFQLRRVRAGSAVDVLSTVATIDTTELTSEDAATPYVINTSNDDLATGDKLFPDVDAISTTPPEGVSFTIEAQLP